MFGKLCFEKLAEVLGLQMGKDNPAGLPGLRSGAVQDLFLEFGDVAHCERGMVGILGCSVN